MSRSSQRTVSLLAIAVVVTLVAGGVGASMAGVVSLPWQQDLVRSAGCTPVPGPDGWSIARRWNQSLLDAIRRDLPAPTVHARNLFHLSAAMWDAWAAYDPVSVGYLVREKPGLPTGSSLAEAREIAISYAAHRLLSERYIRAVGADRTLSAFDDLLDDLCLPLTDERVDGTDPAALGNRIAAAYLAYGLEDGSNEAGRYRAEGYTAANPPLVVSGSDATMVDPSRWQPLEVENMVTQNGIPIALGVQQAIGVHWGRVRSFALPAPLGDDTAWTAIDPGPPPSLGDPRTAAALRDELLETIRATVEVDPSDPTVIDISPASLGGNTLGTDDGTGHPSDPAGRPYPRQPVRRSDFTRIVAEYWADGPNSETPPGHWNVIANAVGDRLAPDLRIGGVGERLDRLAWDVTLYLALNGAVHDAAIAAWGLKGRYDSPRPISLIRYMGGLGQSSDPSLPSYDPRGLPLSPGLVELVTADSTAPGAPMAALRGHEGDVAVRSWAGTPADPKRDVGGVVWRRAVDWVPYQPSTFVTPAFPGYVSGHSTFSRSAAVVLAGLTGSDFFPGGAETRDVPAGALHFEAGPTTGFTLSWATYYDAADQAGRSRLWGGIHLRSDDLTGRRVGAVCGEGALRRALAIRAGTDPGVTR